MKKLLIALLVLGNIPLRNFAQEISQNCELASIIQVDGKTDEWQLPWVLSGNKIFSVSICSDNSNIYVRMKTADETVKRKIALFGLTMWMDTNGKRKKKLGLRFPTGVEAKDRSDALRKTENERKEMNATQRDEFFKQLDKDLIKDLEVLELIGLTNAPLTSTRSGITNGLQVNIGSEDDGTYMYEALIPFKSFRLSKSSISTLAIGFETGKFTPPVAKAGAANVPQGGPGRGGYGGYGGGYGGGGYGGFGSSGSSRSIGNSGYRGSNPMMYNTIDWTFVKMK